MNHRSEGLRFVLFFYCRKQFSRVFILYQTSKVASKHYKEGVRELPKKADSRLTLALKYTNRRPGNVVAYFRWNVAAACSEHFIISPNNMQISDVITSDLHVSLLYSVTTYLNKAELPLKLFSFTDSLLMVSIIHLYNICTPILCWSGV